MPVLYPAFQKSPPPAAPGLDRTHVAKALKAFFVIGELWDLSSEQMMNLLGVSSRSTFYKWKKQPESVSPNIDLATRLSHILAIFRALELLYQKPEHADRWVNAPNLAFGGQSALERMMAGQITDLAVVHDYLDSVRGGW